MRKAKRSASLTGSKLSLKLLTSISLPNEPVLEKWARLARFSTATKAAMDMVTTKKQITLIDFGCGQDILLYNYICDKFPSVSKTLHYIGVDPLISHQKMKNRKQVKLFTKKFEKSGLSVKADIITMLAVLEHVEDPTLLIEKALKSLNTNGILVITTPTPLAKLVLEFFAYVLGIISKREIDEHKRYLTKKSLTTITNDLQLRGFRISMQHRYFEFGLNNLFLIRKTNK